MAKEFRLPKLSDEMTEGTISRWLKGVGDAVAKGEPIVEVETEKVIVEVEAPQKGVIVRIVAQEQEVLPVDGVLCLIGKASEVQAAEQKAQKPAPPSKAKTSSETTSETMPTLQIQGAAAGGGASNAVSMPRRTSPMAPAPSPHPLAPQAEGTTPPAFPVSPLARRVAESLEIDLSGVTGSGVGGKVVMADLKPYLDPPGAGATVLAEERAAVSAVSPAPPGLLDGEIPHGALRRTVARRMSESKREIPHFYMTAEIDVTEALRVRERLNASVGPVKVSVNDLMIKAVALALEWAPELNAVYTENALRRFEEIHIGFAAAIEEGLVTPVVRDCHLKSIGTIAREARQLTEKARARRLTPQDLQGATFTISNLGMFPVVEFSAIINPPQVGILAIARPVERPVPDRGGVLFRRMMNATLSADHRAVDGVTGARFLEALTGVLEAPERLML